MGGLKEDVERCSVYHGRGSPKPYYRINSPLPRLVRYIGTAPAAGSGHYTARQGAFCDRSVLCSDEIGDFDHQTKQKTLLVNMSREGPCGHSECECASLPRSLSLRYSAICNSRMSQRRKRGEIRGAVASAIKLTANLAIYFEPGTYRPRKSRFI